jgi:hypothetical protein
VTKISWTDKKAIETILKLRDKFKVKTFVETGTFKGINARLFSRFFQEVKTCEIDKKLALKAKDSLRDLDNVTVTWCKSEDFLKRFVEDYDIKERDDIVIFYLDAHFYDSKLPKKERFVILRELKALYGFKNCIIIIHDFDNNLGHIVYDNIPLNMELIKFDLKNINGNFKFYTNDLLTCDIVKSPREIGMPDSFDIKDALWYVWSNPIKTYRGILYSVPSELNKDFEIKEWNLACKIKLPS